MAVQYLAQPAIPAQSGLFHHRWAGLRTALPPPLRHRI